MLEEAYEVVEAIDEGNDEELIGESGRPAASGCVS
jgi:uncharacterized protein YabN with tetrapyrrole methylase and pyrophosphatase domain